MEAASKNFREKEPFFPPGPGGLPIAGSMFDYLKDMLGFLVRMREKYGDIAYFKLGSRKMYLVSNPELIKDVLVTHNRNFTKSRALQRAKIVLGEGLLTSEGEHHIKQRKIIQPVFHQKRIRGYGDTMAEYARALGEKWHNGQVVDIHNEMMRLSLAIVSKTIFDADVESESDEIGKSLTNLVTLFPRLMMPYSEFLDKLPLPSNKRCELAIEHLDNIIYRLIDERRKGKKAREDLLSMLLEAQDEGSGSVMSNEQLRDEAITLFLAGQETTANSLTWTMYLISQHPEVDKKMQDEIAEVLGGKLPALDDLGKLSYTERVFKEALRIYPPAWAVARRAIEDYDLGGYCVPRGTDIFMSQFVVHRDPRFYKDPLRFDPDRWTPEFEAELPKFAYFPFGGGPRRCIGEPFAWMEGVIVLSTLMSGWKMRLVPNQKIEPEALITIRPKHGVKMILEKRT